MIKSYLSNPDVDNTSKALIRAAQALGLSKRALRDLIENHIPNNKIARQSRRQPWDEDAVVISLFPQVLGLLDNRHPLLLKMFKADFQADFERAKADAVTYGSSIIITPFALFYRMVNHQDTYSGFGTRVELVMTIIDGYQYRAECILNPFLAKISEKRRQEVSDHIEHALSELLAEKRMRENFCWPARMQILPSEILVEQRIGWLRTNINPLRNASENEILQALGLPLEPEKKAKNTAKGHQSHQPDEARSAGSAEAKSAHTSKPKLKNKNSNAFNPKIALAAMVISLLVVNPLFFSISLLSSVLVALGVGAIAYGLKNLLFSSQSSQSDFSQKRKTKPSVKVHGNKKNGLTYQFSRPLVKKSDTENNPSKTPAASKRMSKVGL